MYMVSVVILFYEVYLWVVFVNFYQPFLKKSIYTRVEYLLTVFCHYHYMIVAVIHAITLFAILYFFHNRSIARRFRIVYIYLLTQVVLRSNHKLCNLLSIPMKYKAMDSLNLDILGYKVLVNCPA